MALKLTNLPVAWGENDNVVVIQYKKCSVCDSEEVPSLCFGIDGGFPIVTICKKCALKYFRKFDIANKLREKANS